MSSTSPPPGSSAPSPRSRPALLAIATLFAIAIAVFIAYSGDEEPEPKAEPTAQQTGPRRLRLCKALDCSPEQVEAIGPILVRHRQETKGFVQSMRRAEKELGKLLQAEALDEDALKAALSAHAEAERAQTERALETLAALHAELRETQRIKLGKMVARRGPAAALEGKGKKKRGKKKRGKNQRPKKKRRIVPPPADEPNADAEAPAKKQAPAAEPDPSQP